MSTVEPKQETKPAAEAPSKEEFAYCLLANALTVEDFEAACEEARRLGLDPDELVDFEPPTQTNEEAQAKRIEFVKRWQARHGDSVRPASS